MSDQSGRTLLKSLLAGGGGRASVDLIAGIDQELSINGTGKKTSIPRGREFGPVSWSS